MWIVGTWKKEMYAKAKEISDNTNLHIIPNEKELSTYDMIFRFVYTEVIKDAVMRNAYDGKKVWMWDKENIEELAAPLMDYIDTLMKGKFKNQKQHDRKFCKVAKDLCDVFNKKSEESNFTFGNAQKLINMTAKYFYIACFYDLQKRESFRFCHCPVDTDMLALIWGEKPFFEDRTAVADCYNKTAFTESWSNMNWVKNEAGEDKMPQRYIDYQKAVRNLVKGQEIPLEVDYRLW